MKMIPEWALYVDWRDAFAGVMNPAYYSIDWLDARLLAGEVRLWGNDRAAIIAEIKTYPTGAKDVCGVVAAGNLQEIIVNLIPQAEEWGRSERCIGAMIISRPEWGTALASHGYAPHQFTIYKEL